MTVIETAFILLVVATAIVALAPLARLPIEVLLLLGSLALSFIPGLPPIRLDPQIVFLLFLPPILFAAAYFTSWRDFKANLRPISFLAIGLVLFTTGTVAVVARHMIPTLSWPAAFILGAMVSPPDASAATAIVRKLGVPRRLVTIIEGESLVNDSTALVCYKFAIAAALTGVFSLKMAFAKFLWVGAGGVVTGLFVGWTGIWLLRHIQETTGQTLLSFLASFAAYVLGEWLGVSGVISTVTAGLYFGRWIPARGSAQTRIESKAGWDLFLFIINAFVFTLIGFALPEVLRQLEGYSRWSLFIDALAVSVAVIVVRFLWVFPATYLPRWVSPSLRRRDPSPPWTAVILLSWTAMRGIVTLAAALSLPRTLSSGAPFPHRALLIFLAYTVILSTLLLPSLTLPKLMVWLGLKAGDERHREETQARIAMVKAVLENLERLKSEPQINTQHVAELCRRYSRRLEILTANLSDSAYSPVYDEDRQQRRLLREVLSEERSALVKLREDGGMHDEVFHEIVRELDLEDLRLLTQRL